MKNADMPATAIFNAKGGVLDLTDGTVDSGYLSQNGRVFATGLTKREAFAMAAMKNILSSYNPYEQGQFDSSDFELTVTNAIGLADAMLKELDK